MDTNIAKQQKKKFTAAFDRQVAAAERDKQFEHVRKYPKRYKKYAYNFLDRIYARGIGDISPEHANKGKDFVININRGNTNKLRTLENIATVSSANEILSDSLPYSKLYEPEFLLPLLTSAIVPNMYYSDSLTQRFMNAQLDGIIPSRGMVQKGELIIAKDGIVTEDINQKLISYRKQYLNEFDAQQPYFGVFFGYFLLTLLAVGAYLMYLKEHHKEEIFDKFANLTFMLLWLVVISYLVYLVEGLESISAYLIPFCIVPIVVKNFFNERLALFTHVVVILVASYLTSLGYEFTFLQILAGIVAVLAYTDTRDWSRFFFTLLYIFFVYALGHFGLSLIKEGSINSIDYSIYPWLIISTFLTLLAIPLIPLLERLFGFTSAISLVELSDLNRPLLKELSLKAPGTLQHSLQVANLSEAAATAIGANALLVKVAALYHDIGKTVKPEYFIENQKGDNPHSTLSNFDSAKIIINHVTDGVKLAKKNKLPTVLIDFIKTHHGDTRVEYFYRNQLKENPDKQFDESLFRYPGPRPRTKEETILMVADSLEAASKSLRNPTGQDIDQLVDNIIAGKITNGQFENSELSFEELEKCIKVFKELLRSINHVRIEYPEEKGM